MIQDRVECRDRRSDAEIRDRSPPRYAVIFTTHPHHPLAVSFTDITGGDVSSTINPNQMRLIGYPAMTALAPGDPANGRVSDRELAGLFEIGGEQAAIRIAADPTRRLDSPTADRARGSFSSESREAPSAEELEHGLRLAIRRIPDANEDTSINQLREDLAAAFQPIVRATGRTPAAYLQIARILSEEAIPNVEDREWPDFRN